MLRVPLPANSRVAAVIAPDAVKVTAPLRLRSEYVAVGMLSVPVNVKLPLDALGIEIAPVDTVILPELVRVLLTVKPFEPIANVSPVPKDRVAAVIEPAAVNVLLSVVESRVSVA